MKKTLLATAALAGATLMATPAHAALKMSLGGYFYGYGIYADNHPAAGTALAKYEFTRYSELHVNGETTLDNGLTVGAHYELFIADFAAGGNGTIVDHAYIYGSGNWGRANFGDHYGAGYLLQVAAPSADSNIDGLHVYVQDLDTAAWNAKLAGLVLDYHLSDFTHTDRLTYLTPKFNGFQAGISYAPYPTAASVGSSVAAPVKTNVAGHFKNPWEIAARWNGVYQGAAMSLGAGYSYAAAENSAGAGAGNAGSDAMKSYDFGANIAKQGFSLGGAYKHSNNGISGAANGADTAIYDIGAGYDTGPYHAALSYFHEKFDGGLLAATPNGASVHRYTLGGGYTVMPGMDVRGTVSCGQYRGTANTDFQQVTIGTNINF